MPSDFRESADDEVRDNDSTADDVEEVGGDGAFEASSDPSLGSAHRCDFYYLE